MTAVLELYEFAVQGINVGYAGGSATRKRRRRAVGIEQYQHSIHGHVQGRCGLLRVCTSPGEARRTAASCDFLDDDNAKPNECVGVTGGDQPRRPSASGRLIGRLYDLYLVFPARMHLGNLRTRVAAGTYARFARHDVEDVLSRVRAAAERVQAMTGLARPLERAGFVLRVDSRPDRWVLFGDLHGSFHGFFRSLLRLHYAGVLDVQTWKLREGWGVCFLGDLVDYGTFAFEILRVVVELVCANDAGTVLVNRGNHEALEINRDFGWGDELETKFGQGDGHRLLEAFDALFASCPSAIVLQGGGKRFWLCHGGVPFLQQGDGHDDHNNVNEQSQPLLLDDLRRGNVQVLSRDSAMQARWNDFAVQSDAEENTVPKFNEPRRVCCVLNQLHAQRFMRENRIDFVVRGHQDLYGNSFLLSDSAVLGRNATGLLLDEAADVSGALAINPDAAVSERRHGPIARVACFDPSGVALGAGKTAYPVITLSTCNDKPGASIYKDGFAVLRFDGPADLSDFREAANAIDTRRLVDPRTLDQLFDDARTSGPQRGGGGADGNMRRLMAVLPDVHSRLCLDSVLQARAKLVELLHRRAPI